MVKISVRIGKSAEGKFRNIEKLRKSALEAYQTVGGGEIFCLPFTAEGKQFALSSRLVLDIDFLPNRIPPRPLRGVAPKIARKPSS